MSRRTRLQSEASPAPPLSDTDAKSNRVQESEVLFPVDKSLPDGEWPTFLLKDAVVTSIRGNETNENLLLVETRGPFKVQGRLLVDFEDKHQMSATRARRPPRNIDIEITGVRMSIGWDNGPRIWVASDYGFFELIHASPEYARMFNSMMEAITMYYSVQAVYDKAEETGEKSPSFDDVLFGYMLHTGEALVREEVLNRCHEHAQFLASHFQKEEEFNWAGKDFTKYIKSIWRFQKKHPGALPLRPNLQPSTPAKDEPQVHKPSRARSVRQESTTSAKSQSPATRTADPQQPPPLPVPAARTETPKLPPSAVAPASVTTDQRSETTALKLYQAIVEIAELDKMDANQIGKTTLSRLGGNIFYKYKFSAYKGVPEAIKYYAHDLVRLMNADNSLAAKWRVTPFYATLASIEVPLLPDKLENIKPGQIDTSLVRRQPKNASNGDPPAASTAAPVAKPSGKAPPPAGYQSASDTSSSLTRPRRGRLSGKVAGLRLANSKKRPHSDVDSPASSGKGTTGSKRSRVAVNDFEGEEENYGEVVGEDADDINMASESSESSEEMAVSDGEPDQVPARIVLEVEDLPSTSPMGPNGTWVCENEDCGYVIRCADEAEGQEAVRMHLHEHEDRSRKVRLALAEGRATGHPSIDYLLEKLKQVGGRELAKRDPNRPQPIQKKHGLLF